ncbi:triacylglycerol lipase [Pseudarthrobacter sp. NamB4]|uniref:esterase/lipase family protein n=1 Tax=Pseudarthrobacter sp. NamB4 TaxID=2576837 RepID=UPI0010FD23E7|nr:alpha/beta fold hydrolase [Pseudarthrobacter sp. NamB4]TLM74522.1 alpha/beta hydrolase [Pseudarthrobacter sp. NamB4]
MGTTPSDGRLPIIYVRGFAGTGSAINSAVDDPFYGFSQGSVHVRADGSGRAKFHQFESPMLRLVADHKYEVPVHGDQWAFLNSADAGSVNSASIWIHRFYDDSANTFDQNPEDFSFEEAARDLFGLIKLVLEKTGAPKVFLVAHSMGGLICRSLLQRVIPESLAGDDGAVDPAAGAKYVARVFTYATPHGGIRFAVGFGLFEKIRDATRFQGADIFGPDRMYEYLTPPALRRTRTRDAFRATEMPDDGFPVQELFCLVGSNPEDYDVAMGLSSKAVGTRSDGLVQIDNAAVKGAVLAVVHRSHSGRYGIVNSEEGYQNLQRFLFGDLKIEVELVGFTVGKADPPEVEYQLDVGLAIRGLPVLVHEQSAAHFCPVQVEHWKEGDPIDSPVPLLTTFLSSKAPRPRVAGREVPRLRHALKLKLMSIIEKDGHFFFADHLEQTEDWQDTLLVDIEPPSADRPLPKAWAAWNSTVPTALRDWNPTEEDLLRDTDPTQYRWQGFIPVPKFSRDLLGHQAGLRLTVTPRTLTP